MQKHKAYHSANTIIPYIYQWLCGFKRKTPEKRPSTAPHRSVSPRSRRFSGLPVSQMARKPSKPTSSKAPKVIIEMKDPPEIKGSTEADVDLQPLSVRGCSSCAFQLSAPCDSRPIGISIRTEKKHLRTSSLYLSGLLNTRCPESCRNPPKKVALRCK